MEPQIISTIFGLLFFLGFVLIMRLLGSWMLRINDVIHYQKEIVEELKKLNSK